MVDLLRYDPALPVLSYVSAYGALANRAHRLDYPLPPIHDEIKSDALKVDLTHEWSAVTHDLPDREDDIYGSDVLLMIEYIGAMIEILSERLDYFVPVQEREGISDKNTYALYLTDIIEDDIASMNSLYRYLGSML